MNNPTNFVDPTGHSALDIIKKISATNNKLAALRKDRAKCVIPPYVSNDVANIIKERAKNFNSGRGSGWWETEVFVFNTSGNEVYHNAYLGMIIRD